MAYDIPLHRLESLQRSPPDALAEMKASMALQEEPKSTQTEMEQVYTYVGHSKDGRYDRHSEQLEGYIPPDSVKLMLPFGPDLMR